MYLCEEYFHRHGINVQYARHVDRGAIFFKTDYDFTWRILSIRWKLPSVHPGTYHIKTVKPVHDGYRGRALFESTSKDLSIHWDEYESFIMKWAASLSGDQIASSVKKAHLAAWDMLLYCCDDAIKQQGYQNQFNNTTDVTFNVDERFMALQESLVFISKNFVALHEVWICEMGPYLRDYCYWLADLVVHY